MHRTNKYLAACAMAALCLCTACQDDDLFSSGKRVVEGIPTRVTLGYESLESVVETRAAQDAVYENRIENIYLMVFNEAGGRVEISDSLFTFEGNLHPDNDNVSLGKGTLEFVCPSLNNATIVGIANVTHAETVTAYDVTPDDLDAVTTLEGLHAMVMRMNAPSVSRSALFMMTGYAEGADGNKSITIAGNESNTNPQWCTLRLERTDAKVEVNVISEAAESSWTGFSFRPLTWRVVQVPMQSLILPSDNTDVDADGDGCTYFASTESPFETLTSNKTGTQDVGGGFVFYMPENLKKPLQEIEATEGLTSEQLYALREQWTTESHTDPAKPEQEVQNIAFANANENSTYLEITGHLTYSTGSNVVDATTRYYVHLGYDKGNPNDYATRRNKHYRYNLTVKGINDIEVEVRDEDEGPRPGHEGDVIYSNNLFNFDCHYDRRLITLNKADIAKEGLSWYVSTPYSHGVHTVGEEIPKSMRDYRWIKFAINSDYGVSPGTYVKYPGDQNYNDPHVKDGENDNAPSPYYTTGDGGYHPNARLLDIEQLLTRLKEDDGTLYDDNGNVAITVFVDEYLYVKNPLVDNAKEELIRWKECVNRPDRLMHIISDDSRIFSIDGNSSVVNSIYTFKQKSIRTIYNLDSDVERAWGLETVMEGDRYPVGEGMPSTANSMDNGRYNTWEYFSANHRELKWTDILGVNDGGHYDLINDNYRNVFYATLIRNRDLNGDNVVDENEIRWYLAAINQLDDIYIGEYALDQESRLYPWNPQNEDYPPNNNNSVYWHYTSSTYQGNGLVDYRYVNYPYVVWAEEGPSKGNYPASKGSNGANYAYRCLRNLGIGINDMDTSPDKLITYIKNSDGSYTFDLSRLDPKAIRSNYVEGAGTYPIHNEKSQNNLPYVKFRVSAKTYTQDGERNWQYYQTANPCASDNYRVPNLRELLIYTSRLYSGHDANGHHLLSFTGFSLSSFGAYKGRLGYSFNTGDGSMGPSNENLGYVRGVRDEQ